MQKQFANIAALGLLTATASAQPSYPEPDEIIFDSIGGPDLSLMSFDTTLQLSVPDAGQFTFSTQTFSFDQPMRITSIGGLVYSDSSGFPGDIGALTTAHFGFWNSLDSLEASPLLGDIHQTQSITEADFVQIGTLPDAFRRPIYYTEFELAGDGILVDGGDEFLMSLFWEKPGDYSLNVPRTFRSIEDLGPSYFVSHQGLNGDPFPTMTYVVTGYVVPSPSALALLGVAGLMTPRRRRGEK